MRNEITYAMLFSFLLLSVLPVSASAASLAVTIAQQRVVMTAGQTNLLSANVSGGTGNYTCNWSYYPFTNPAYVTPFANQSCTVIFHGNSSDLASPDVISMLANDSAGDTGGGIVFVAVKPGLSLLITPSASTVYAGGTVSITNTTANYGLSYTGSPPYVFYYLLPPTGVIENGNGFLFTAPGTYQITEVVNDSNGASVSASTTITVLAPAVPIIVALSTPPYTTVSAGQSIPLSASASGGIAPYSYAWYVNGVQNASSTSSAFAFTPVTAGTYSVYASAYDQEERTNSSPSIGLTVTPPLEFSLFSANRTLISTGQSVLLINATNGGTGSNAYSYAVSGCTGYTQMGNGILFDSAGACTVTEYVSDLTGEVNQSIGVQITVTPPLKTVLRANWTLISAYQSASFTNTTSGGTGNNTYAYSFNCNGVAQAGNRMTFASAGTCNVALKVSDASGEKNQSNITITVTPPLKFTSFSANWTLISVGQSVLLINTTSGGTGGNGYSYAVTGCTGYVQNGNKFLFNTAGTCNVTEYVTDFTGEVNKTQAIRITVTPPLVATLQANATTIGVGKSVRFTNSTTGGTGLNAYSYGESSKTGLSQKGNVFTFNSVGNYLVTLTVTDVSGETSSSSVPITVTKSPVPGCTGSNKGGVLSITASSKTTVVQITNQSAVQITGSSDKVTINMPGGNCNIAVMVTGSSDQISVYNGTITLQDTGSLDTVNMYGTVLSSQALTGSSDKVVGGILNGNSFAITGSSNLVESFNVQKLSSLTLTGSAVNITLSMLAGSPAASIKIVGSSDLFHVVNGTIGISITGSSDTFYYHGTTITSQSVTGSGDKIIKN